MHYASVYVYYFLLIHASLCNIFLSHSFNLDQWIPKSVTWTCLSCMEVIITFAAR